MAHVAGAAYLAYEMGLPQEKRDLLTTVISNRQVDGKTVGVTLAPPFDEVANRFQTANSAPYRDTARTWDRFLVNLCWVVPRRPRPYPWPR